MDESLVDSVNEMKTLLSKKNNEIKALNNKLSEFKRETTNLKTKIKSYESVDETIKKEKKARDQLKLSIQTLKQENEAFKNHQETLNSRISSGKDTLESYKAIIQNLEKDAKEKVELAKEQERIIQEQSVQIETHKTLAFTFMDELQGDFTLNIPNISSEAKNIEISELKEQVLKLKESERCLLVKLEVKNASDTEIAKAKELVTNQEKVVKDLIAKLNEMTAAKESLEKASEIKLKENSNEIIQLKKVLGQLEEQNSRNEKEVADLKAEIKNLSALAYAKEVISANSQEDNVSIGGMEPVSNGPPDGKEQLKLMKKELNLAKSGNIELKQCLEDQKQSYFRQLKELHEEIKLSKETTEYFNVSQKLRKIAEGKDKEINELKEHGTFMEKSLSEKDTIIAEMQESLSMLERTMVEKDNTCHELQELNMSLEKSLIEKKNKISEIVNSCSEQQNKIVLLNKKLSESENEKVMASNQLKELDKKLSVSREQVKELVHLNMLRSTKQNPQINDSYHSNETPRTPSHKIPFHTAEKNASSASEVCSTESRIKSVESQELCFTEIRGRGNCTKGHNCRYSHQIPEHLRANKEAGEKIIMDKSLCVNEFKRLCI